MNTAGKYYAIGNGIVHIKEIHDQMARQDQLIELDDYCGNFYNYLTNHWFLNNDNIMFENIVQWSEVYQKDFENKLIEEINKTVTEIKKGNGYALKYFKNTPKRLEMLRKYYVVP